MDKKIDIPLSKKESAKKAFEDLDDDWPTNDPEYTMAHDDRFSDLHLNLAIKKNLSIDKKETDHEERNTGNNRQNSTDNT